MKIKRIRLNIFKLLCCSGRLIESNREIVVFTAYLPPKMTTERLVEFCDFLADTIEGIKEEMNDPVIIITGDFNRKNITRAIQDFPDIQLLPTPPTRGTATLDLTYSNLGTKLHHSDVLPPLEANDGQSASDHKVLYYEASLPGKTQVKRTKKKINFRPYTKRGEEIFGRKLLFTDWSSLSDEEDPAHKLHLILDEYVNEAFPMKTRTVREQEYPWITREIARMSRRKKREYKRHRRSERWKQLHHNCEQLISTSREAFFQRVKTRMIETSNSREFFRAANALAQGDHQKLKSWSINEMFPDDSDEQIAENVSDYFNQISSEYNPLPTTENTINCERLCPEIYQISARIKTIKKPRSQVPGDIPHQLLNKFRDALAIPLHIVFKKAFTTATWPALWKSETVTVIPKCSSPTNLSQLRNLSCTPLFSKLMETFVQDELKKEIQLGPSQFGGIKGSSVDHFLIETWDQILRALEDPRAAATLASIDLEKAFNRVCHHECIKSAASMGASQATLGMIRAFLTGRTMQVKINQTKSRPKAVCGGSPQGSILANILFCITTEQLIACQQTVNIQDSTLSTTHSFNSNGNHSTEHDDSVIVPLSPIARPLMEIELDTESEEEEIRASNFIHFNPTNRWYDSELTDIAVQDTIDRAFGPTRGWNKLPLQSKVYVDDMNSIEKCNRENAISVTTEKKRLQKVHSPLTQALFEKISEKAAEILMKVNQDKTKIVCLSSAVHDQVTSYIRPVVNGEVKETCSTESLKIVGFNFNTSPTVNYHISLMCSRFRSKLWGLRRFKKAGVCSADLLLMYKSILRPIVEFACVTYGPMLTRELSDEIERLQLRATKIIYGRCVSYNTVLTETNLQSLEQRRKERIRKFAEKTVRNSRYSSRWFPRTQDGIHNIRAPKHYIEEHAKTDRLYKSPIFTMRRLLNAQ